VSVKLQVIPLLIQLVQAGAPEAQDAAAVLLADYCKQDDDNARLFRKLGEPCYGSALEQRFQVPVPSELDLNGERHVMHTVYFS
jgi:hypothetical protein